MMGLERIEVGAFCGVGEISLLNLYDNDLKSLPQLCSLKCCLVELQVANNNISRLSKHFLRGFKKLQNINLNDNSLLALPELHWIQHSVAIVKANRNKIHSLDALQTSGIFVRLIYLVFFKNDICHFNVSLLRHMPKLYILVLDGNKLTHIDDFRSLNVRHVNLMSNPWHCGEELSWMGEEDLGFERGLTCKTPTCLHGWFIAGMSEWILFSHCLCFIIFCCSQGAVRYGISVRKSSQNQLSWNLVRP